MRQWNLPSWHDGAPARAAALLDPSASILSRMSHFAGSSGGGSVPSDSRLLAGLDVNFVQPHFLSNDTSSCRGGSSGEQIQGRSHGYAVLA